MKKTAKCTCWQLDPLGLNQVEEFWLQRHGVMDPLNKKDSYASYAKGYLNLSLLITTEVLTFHSRNGSIILKDVALGY